MAELYPEEDFFRSAPNYLEQETYIGPCADFTHPLAYGRVETPEEAKEVISMAEGDRGLAAIPKQVARIIRMKLRPALPNDRRLPSQRAMEEITKCARCILENICPIRVELENSLEQEKADQQMEMFENGPLLLTIARIHGVRVDGVPLNMRTFKALVSDEKATADALQKYFSIDELLGGIQNREIRPLRVQDFPAKLVRHLTCFARRPGEPEPGPFKTHELSSDAAPHKFAFVDLTHLNRFKGERPSEPEFANIGNKFLDLIRNRDRNGLPWLLSPELRGKFFSVIRNFPGGYIAEMRMAGKNRLYIAVVLDPMQTADTSDGATHLVVAITMHKGDEDTQEECIKAAGFDWDTWNKW